MGARGPKPGFRKAAPANAAGAPSKPTQAPTKKAEAEQPVVVALSAADRENPAKLSGDALKKLAHRRGMPMSSMQSMSDEKIRTELSYIIRRQYEEAATAE